MATVFHNGFQKEFFAILRDRGAATVTCTFGVYGNDITPDPALNADQFEATDYRVGGDDTSTVEFTTPGIDEDGLLHAVVPPVDRSNDNTVDSGDIFGWWVAIASTGASFNTWMAEKFDQPISLAPGDLLFITPEVVLQPAEGSAIIDR